jgi:ABC-type uncharacterized transport system substrate-binding protein
MRRTGLAVVLSLGLTLVPFAAEAQPERKVYRVGVLVHGAPRTTQEARAQDPFVNALRELGWVEGRNLGVEDRRSMNVEQLHSLAAELVQLKVDVVYASGTPATRAVKQATSSIPIVMVVGVDPVSDGLVASLPRPGGNVTGITTLGSELIGKRLGLLKEVIPGVSRVAFMWNPANPGNVSTAEEVMKVAPTMGVRVQPVPVRDPEEFDSALASMTKGRADALMVGAYGMLVAHRARLAELAVKHRIPANVLVQRACGSRRPLGLFGGFNRLVPARRHLRGHL